MVDFSVESHLRAKEAFKQGKYNEALTHARKWLTWYRLCHLAHTVPFLRSGTPESKALLKIDIEALNEGVSTLISCYAKCGLLSQVPQLLAAVSNSIHDDQWTWKIRYHRALWHIVYNNDNTAARNEIKDINISKVNDDDLLSLHLQLHVGELDLESKLKICARIALVTDSPSYKLKYQTLRGIFLNLSGESKRGTAEIEKAIQEYTDLPDHKKSFYGDFELAHSVHSLAVFTNNRELSKDASVRYSNIVKRAEAESLGPSYISEALKYNADACLDAGEVSMAIELYKRSLSLCHSSLTEIFYARAMVYQNRLVEAKGILRSLNYDNLEPSGQFDYGVTAALLAFSSKDKNDINAAVKSLRGAGEKMLYFNNMRSEIIANLYEIEAIDNTGAAEKGIRKLLRYAELKPNFFGIGINLNEIINDVLTAKERKGK